MAFSDLVTKLTADSTGLQKGLRTGQTAVHAFSGSLGVARGAAASLISTLGPLLSVFAAYTSVAKSIGLANEFEDTESAFKVILGDLGEAKVLLSEIEKFSASTPFGMSELAQGVRGLLSFGRTSREAMDDLQNLGDIAAATKKPIADYVDIFGKVFAKRKLQGEELNRLIERGVPILEALTDVTGKQGSELQKMLSSGEIGFPKFLSAMRSITAEGGKFAGGMKEASTTTTGLWSTFKDNVSLIFKDLGTTMIEAFGFKKLLEESTGFAQTFRSQWLPSIRAVLVSVGKSLQQTVSFMKSVWDSWLGGALKEALFFGENFGLVFAIIWEEAKLFVSNTWERFKTFFTNIGEAFTWFLGNWKDVLKSMANLLLTTVKNMVANMGEFFRSVWEFAKGKGFKPKFKGLTDGFESSIKELPKFTKAAVQDSNAELDMLRNALADARNKFDSRFEGGAAGELQGLAGESQQAQSEIASKQEFKPNESFELGTQKAFEKILGAQSGSNRKSNERKAFDEQKKQSGFQNEMVRFLEEIARKIGIEKVVEF